MKTFVSMIFFCCTILVQAQINYNTQIRPIFVNYGCIGCHGGSGGLFLTPFSNIFTTGNHKPVIVPGDTNSYLIKKLKGDPTAGSRMPLGDNPIAEAELRLIIQWVREGAKETPTFVKNDISPITTYQLNQNFPNPFNPVTKIRFSIGRTESVTLQVFDLLGKEITTLIQQNLSAGSYEADFGNSILPSGVYLYKLQVGNYSEIRKMTLMK